MRLKYSLLLVLFFTISCKSIKGLDYKESIQSILTKHNWYEVCNNSKSRIYTYTSSKFTKTEYDNEDFTDFNYKKEYQILKYQENGLKLQRNNEVYNCSIVYDVKDLTYIQMECNSQHKFILLNGWSTKELAAQNRAACY